MSTPVLDKARHKLNLPLGWDLSKNELEFYQVFKKKYLKKFKLEIIRLVEEQKLAAATAKSTVAQNVPAVGVPVTTTTSSLVSTSLPDTL